MKKTIDSTKFIFLYEVNVMQRNLFKEPLLHVYAQIITEAFVMVNTK